MKTTLDGSIFPVPLFKGVWGFESQEVFRPYILFTLRGTSRIPSPTGIWSKMKITNDLKKTREELTDDSLAVLNRGMTSLGYVHTNNRRGSGLLGPRIYGRRGYGECVVNAIVSLTGRPYKAVYNKLAEVNARWSEYLIDRKDFKDSEGRPINPYWFGKKTFRFGTNTEGWDFGKYANSIGLKKIIPKSYISISEAHREYGDCMVCFMTGHNIGHAAVVREGKLYDWGDTRISRWKPNNKLEVDESELADYFYRNGFNRDGFGTIEEIKTNDCKKKWLVCGAWEPWARTVWVEEQKTLYYLKYSLKYGDMVFDPS